MGQCTWITGFPSSHRVNLEILSLICQLLWKKPYLLKLLKSVCSPFSEHFILDALWYDWPPVNIYHLRRKVNNNRWVFWSRLWIQFTISPCTSFRISSINHNYSCTVLEWWVTFTFHFNVSRDVHVRMSWIMLQVQWSSWRFHYIMSILRYFACILFALYNTSIIERFETFTKYIKLLGCSGLIFDWIFSANIE